MILYDLDNDNFESITSVTTFTATLYAREYSNIKTHLQSTPTFNLRFEY